MTTPPAPDSAPLPPPVAREPVPVTVTGGPPVSLVVGAVLSFALGALDAFTGQRFTIGGDIGFIAVGLGALGIHGIYGPGAR